MRLGAGRIAPPVLEAERNVRYDSPETRKEKNGSCLGRVAERKHWILKVVSP